jgi:deoxycytidylate deaminase
MYILTDEAEIATAMEWLKVAAEYAAESTCHRSKCGSVIISKWQDEIGAGYNSMPCNATGECFKDKLAPTFKSDKTCCMHAEQRAIMQALKYESHHLPDSRLYFIRLDDEGKMKFSGEPYCTICSKMALDAGIAEFVLYRKEGICVYDTKEYNEISFEYK